MVSGTVSSSQLEHLLNKETQTGAQTDRQTAGCQWPFLFVINSFFGICHLHNFSVMIFFFFLLHFSSKSLVTLRNKIVAWRLEATCSVVLFFCLRSWSLTYLLNV